MSPEQMKEAVENHSELAIKREKLNRQLIRMSGRDPEQEMYIVQRMQQVERMLTFIDDAISDEDILNLRESCAVEHRTLGTSIVELQALFSLTGQGVRNILGSAYKKMSEAYSY